MNQSNWKSLSVLACAFIFGAALHASASVPAIVLVATDPTALEGTTTGAFTLIRYGDTNGDLAVNVAISGTASNGVDYAPISTVLTIPAGYLALDVPVQPIADTANRGNKTVVLTLQKNDAAYHIVSGRKATVKIVDDVFNIPPPTVSLVSPEDGTAFTSPSSITLTAEVSDPQLIIKNVSFYANDELLGRVTTSPYTLVWDHPRKGDYALFSRAVDEFGKSAVSSAVNITISDSPVVTLTTDGMLYNVGNIATFQAQINDPNEAISSVNFSVNNKVVGTVTSAPFTFQWQTTKVGTFNVQAVAVDKNSGKKGTSSKVPITVNQNGAS